jgi:acyl-CoA thioester hydrolase
MASSYQTTRRVEFCDTDAAGMMHFTAFFRFMEQAEHELLRQLGSSVVSQDAEGSISWPRASANCDFQRAVAFEDELTIQLSVARLGTTSVTYQCNFQLDGEAVARGQIVSVCCRMTADAAPEPLAIPAALREQLQHYVSPQQD